MREEEERKGSEKAGRGSKIKREDTGEGEYTSRGGGQSLPGRRILLDREPSPQEGWEYMTKEDLAEGVQEESQKAKESQNAPQAFLFE